MSKLYYTEANFKFSKKIQLCKQYFLNKFSDTDAISSFLRRFEGTTAIYAVETSEGTKIGITENLNRRFKDLIKPWVPVKNIFFITFSNIIDISFLESIELLIKKQNIQHTKKGSSEFFVGKTCFEIANRIKFFFHKKTSKYNRVSCSKVKFHKKVYDTDKIKHFQVKTHNYKELGDLVYSFYKDN